MKIATLVLWSLCAASEREHALLRFLERESLAPERKREVIDLYFDVFIAQAQLEWRGLLLKKVLALQSLLHDAVERSEPLPAEEGLLRARLVDDELEWRAGLVAASKQRERLLRALKQQAGDAADSLLAELQLERAPYDEERLRALKYARAVAGAEALLAEAERGLAAASGAKATPRWIGPSATGIVLPDNVATQSARASALRRRDDARERVLSLRLAAEREAERLFDAREHMEADLLLAQVQAVKAIATTHEMLGCAKLADCAFADALGAYTETVALKRTWLRVHQTAASIESEIWRGGLGIDTSP